MVIHGHADDRIRDAIVAQLDRGTQFGCPEWDLQYRMASLLIEAWLQARSGTPPAQLA